MDIPRIRQRIARLRDERAKLEEQLMNLRLKLVEGCLSERYTECRKGNCKCTRGEPHGPFLYMSAKERGKIRYRYVGKKEDRKIVEGLRRYKDFQLSLGKLRKTNHKINMLWNEYRRGLVKK